MDCNINQLVTKIEKDVRKEIEAGKVLLEQVKELMRVIEAPTLKLPGLTFGFLNELNNLIINTLTNGKKYRDNLASLAESIDNLYNEANIPVDTIQKLRGYVNLASNIIDFQMSYLRVSQCEVIGYLKEITKEIIPC